MGAGGRNVFPTCTKSEVDRISGEIVPTESERCPEPDLNIFLHTRLSRGIRGSYRRTDGDDVIDSDDDYDGGHL